MRRSPRSRREMQAVRKLSPLSFFFPPEKKSLVRKCYKTKSYPLACLKLLRLLHMRWVLLLLTAATSSAFVLINYSPVPSQLCVRMSGVGTGYYTCVTREYCYSSAFIPISRYERVSGFAKVAQCPCLRDGGMRLINMPSLRQVSRRSKRISLDMKKNDQPVYCSLQQVVTMGLCDFARICERVKVCACVCVCVCVCD